MIGQMQRIKFGVTFVFKFKIGSLQTTTFWGVQVDIFLDVWIPVLFFQTAIFKNSAKPSINKVTLVVKIPLFECRTWGFARPFLNILKCDRSKDFAESLVHPLEHLETIVLVFGRNSAVAPHVKMQSDTRNSLKRCSCVRILMCASNLSATNQAPLIRVSCKAPVAHDSQILFRSLWYLVIHKAIDNVFDLSWWDSSRTQVTCNMPCKCCWDGWWRATLNFCL